MKKIAAIIISVFAPLAVMAQNAMDTYQVSMTQIKGTARYVSMGGAFTALGGDMSSISQNPAGIGVYRNSEFTFSLGGQWNRNTSAGAPTAKNGVFTFDNVGIVGTFNTGSPKGLLSYNIGITYNRNNSFNRKYNGTVGNLGASFTNYLENVTRGIPSGDLVVVPDFDAYYDTNSPWLSILGYQSYLFAPYTDNGTDYYGLFNPGVSSGSSYTTIREDGRNDEYTINFGGNVNDRVYFGAALGIKDLSFTRRVDYEEDLYNTEGRYESDNNNISSSNYLFSTYYRMRGTGFNGKFGVIVRASDFLRLGATIHTPTYYSVDQTMDASIDNRLALNDGTNKTVSQTIPTYVTNTIRMQTPWNFQVGAAYIIGKKGILSVDYQYTAYNSMKLKETNGDGFPIENAFYKAQFKAGNTVKVGAEYRLTKSVSLRAGYAIQLSPLKSELKDVNAEVPTVGMQTAYFLPGNASYYSCGIGYRFASFYFDASYQHFIQKSDMFAYSPLFFDDRAPLIPGSSQIKSKQNAINFTVGMRF